MQTNCFPAVYDAEVDKRKTERIRAAEAESASRSASINQRRLNSPSGGSYLTGLRIGLFAGAASCYFCLLPPWLPASEFSMGRGFLAWAITIAAGALIGYISDKSAERNYQINGETVDKRLSEERDRLQAEIADINAEATREKQQYLAQFKHNTQVMSVRFAESELGKEVVAWMCDGFCRTVNAADRRSHIERIEVTFPFQVYGDRISCQLGTYDFEEQRCKKLNDPLELAALTRAIATSMQVNMTMKYPQDASGTNMQIQIKYTYTNNCAKAAVTYVAPNGNYKPVRGW